MAEQYGVKPKRFTKEWWPYFWTYYKWHTIVIAIVIIAIVTYIVNILTEEKYDLVSTYVGGAYYFQEDEIQSLEDTLSSMAEDADGNGKVNVLFSQNYVTGEFGREEMDHAMRMMHDMDFEDENTYLYIYDSTELKRALRENGAADTGMYLKTILWLDDDVEEDMLKTTSDGTPYAVSLKNSTVFKNMNVDSSDLYVLIKDDTNYKKNDIARENAINIANNLIK